ncbi:hypothetical protein [Nonomuraea sp. NPDC049784]|uniref:hypothetical protein n=1 Tax=Nonomuraea sp. NPDC049784 TaxID=3154361 RepID=UPI0033E1F907
MQAIQDALDEHRLTLATTWIDRYGHRPHRVELPAAPSRPRQVIPFDGHPGLTLGKDEQAMLALFDTGWPTLCPRSAEIIGALLDCPRATTARLAELAAAQTPQRWSSPEQWLESSIWDGIRPPDLTLPAAGEDPELDEYPAVQELRRHLHLTRREWESWQAGFAILVEACDDPPVDTMAELLAFWQDIGILVSADDDDDNAVWTLDASLPSPWHVVYARGSRVPPHILAAALDWLLDGDVPLDPDLPPREVFNLIVASGGGSASTAVAVNGGAVGIAG